MIRSREETESQPFERFLTVRFLLKLLKDENNISGFTFFFLF